MWHKEYRDYPLDTPQVQQRTEPNKGIIGCEMHDLNGWGNSHHFPLKKKKKGLMRRILHRFFGGLS